jgi:hypothetical protein
MINPAMIAVIIPFSGLTPEAIANAIASGRATIPTIKPEVRSEINKFLLYSLIEERSWGFNIDVF